MTTLLVASGNRHKIVEIRNFFGTRFQFLGLESFQEAPKVEEDQPTFSGNAVKKARELARWLTTASSFEYRVPGLNAFVLADDSGLEVDALKGAPGVASARFAFEGEPGKPPGADLRSGNAPDAANNAKLLRLLQGVPLEKRTARFRCVLSVIRVKPRQATIAGQMFEGVCEGRILSEARGQGGFGYDPLFLPLGQAQTLAELGAAAKNKLSHRAQALQKLRGYFDVLRL